MGRQKTKMSYIPNDTTRRRIFLKRKACLLKKASELSLLCDVPACVLVAAPCDHPNPVIWPSALDARTLITRFRDLPTSSSRDKTRALDQEAFLAREIARLKEQLGRVERKNREAEVKAALMRCLQGEVVVGADMVEVGSLAEGKAREVAERVERLNGLVFLREAVAEEVAVAPMTTMNVEEEWMMSGTFSSSYEDLLVLIDQIGS
ncbi:Agamous-like MADS-box protein AGL11 [Acorus gramineus]|uniref:Agamous-like MADS-box protein AGL11 n=1 Tax=Acorus gramineus TaxID=55184 RepID=A0AAV9AEJ1_ACOGR|nr:Agamous-like MADS-box protein AGL11 [Acorus gramineus]